jgi:cytochrome c-type biogenesis protein CcmF
VENSSLIPWLVCVALVHSMLVQKRTGSDGTATTPPKVGGLVKTNFALAIAAFGLILYSTFLTRSGVLGDTSVHSFVAPGKFVYAVLLGLIFLFLGLGYGMLFRRWSDLKQKALEMKLMSRENALAIGSSVILASATVVLIGTSWPIFMPLFDKPKVAVPTDFYNNLHLPIAMMIVLLNGISMTLRWKNTPREEFFRKIALALGIAAVGTVGLVLLGITDPIYIGLGFGSLLAITVNIQIGLKILKGNPRMVGAYVSHTGVSLLMLGVIFTARYSVTEHVRLREGEAAKVFDYSIVYKGSERIDVDKPDRESYRYNLELTRDGSVQTVAPVAFWSDFDGRVAPNMEPGILYSVTRDIYIAPKSIEQEGGDPTARMHKGDKAPVPFDSSITVRFDRFDMSRAASEQLQGSVLEVTKGDSIWYLTTFKSIDEQRFIPAEVPGTDISIGMVGLVNNRENQSNSETILQFKSPSHPPGPTRSVVTVDVSIKPFISLVWGGVIIMVGGFFFSIFRRRREIERQIPYDEPPSNGSNGKSERPRARKIRTADQIEEPTVARKGDPELGSQAV